MSERDKLSFQEGEEEEFHITDEDIDRELAAMEVDHSASSANDAPSEGVAEKPSLKQRFAVLKQLKRKHWLIIAVIAIIFLFGLLKVMGSNQSQASFGQITPVPVQATHTAEVAAKKVEMDLTKPTDESTTSSLLSAPPLSAPSSTENHEQLKTDLTALASNETKLTQALETIQQQNQALAQQFTTLSSRVGDVESALTQSSQASQAVEGRAQQAATLKKGDAPTAPLPNLAQSVPAGPQYTVEAVVPQRAWLQAGDGSTLTVMIGDDLPGLGAVISIDPYSGNVTTASGTVIKYGS